MINLQRLGRGAVPSHRVHPAMTDPQDTSVIRVLIADENRQITDNLSRRLALEDDLEVCGTSRDGESAVQDALRLRPDVAILDAGLPGMDGGQTTEMLAQHLPGTGVIMISMEAENDAYRRAMLAGAREFLQKPFKGDDLVAAVRRVRAFEQRRAGAPKLRQLPAQNGSGPHPEPQRRGRLITLISGKGGVGKSALAANLAVALSANHPGRVALVDLSLQFGDQGALLNLKSDRTIADLVAHSAVADPDAVRDVLIEGPGGIRVLLAPLSPEQAEYVTPTHLRALFGELRNTFDLVVVDTAAYLNEITLHAAEHADAVVMVTDLSVTAVKDTQLAFSVLEVLKVNRERVTLVANHREAAGELDRQGAQGFLSASINVEIPYEPRAVATSIQQGVPFVLQSRRSPATAAVQSLARLIDPSSHSSGADLAMEMASDKKRRQRRVLGFSRG